MILRRQSTVKNKQRSQKELRSQIRMINNSNIINSLVVSGGFMIGLILLSVGVSGTAVQGSEGDGRLATTLSSLRWNEFKVRQHSFFRSTIFLILVLMCTTFFTCTLYRYWKDTLDRIVITLLCLTSECIIINGLTHYLKLQILILTRDFIIMFFIILFVSS